MHRNRNDIDTLFQRVADIVLVNITMPAILMCPRPEADVTAVDKELIMILRTDPKQSFVPGTPAEELFAKKQNGIIRMKQIFLPKPFFRP